MRLKEIIAVGLVLLCTIGTVWAVYAYQSNHTSASTVELLAREPDKGNWSPPSIRVEKGQKVNLMIRNVDVVSHGFYLPAYDITVREIKAGEVEKIAFTADAEGKFPFYCTVWCSDHHMHMRGELIIE